jgi:hypothetical protein
LTIFCVACHQEDGNRDFPALAIANELAASGVYESRLLFFHADDYSDYDDITSRRVSDDVANSIQLANWRMPCFTIVVPVDPSLFAIRLPVL